MTIYKFEGDLSGVSEIQLEYVRTILHKRGGFNKEKVIVEAVCEAGDNYIANVKRIVVEKDGELFKMIAKFAPIVEGIRNTMKTDVAFYTEHVMYTELLPKFKELQEAAEVPETERLKFAKCYGSFTEKPNEVILLEDLKLSGFEMLDRFKSLPNDAVKLLLKNFAILHSLSYALKYQEPETFKSFQPKLIYPWSHIDRAAEMQYYIEKVEEDTLLILGNDDRRKYLKGISSESMKAMMELAKIDLESKNSVIVQGDAWTNNIMFILEEGNAVDCCMIDYQMSRQGNPVDDLHYMILNCTEYEARSTHYHDWIDYYHSELDKALANYGLTADIVYPRDQLDADLKNHGKASLGISLILTGILVRETGDAAKMKEALDIFDGDFSKTDDLMESSKVSNLDDESIKRFKKRLEGIIDSLVEYGCL